MQQLAISDRLALPIETVTETIAILAKRGAGKTNTAVVLTEELVSAGQQVIVVDPVGVWYGLRSGADGTSGGIPVLIIGGDHADLPLTETSGEVIARILVGERQSAVLDLSQQSAAHTVATFTGIRRPKIDPLRVGWWFISGCFLWLGGGPGRWALVR